MGNLFSGRSRKEVKLKKQDSGGVRIASVHEQIDISANLGDEGFAIGKAQSNICFGEDTIIDISMRPGTMKDVGADDAQTPKSARSSTASTSNATTFSKKAKAILKKADGKNVDLKDVTQKKIDLFFRKKQITADERELLANEIASIQRNCRAKLLRGASRDDINAGALKSAKGKSSFYEKANERKTSKEQKTVSNANSPKFSPLSTLKKLDSDNPKEDATTFANNLNDSDATPSTEALTPTLTQTDSTDSSPSPLGIPKNKGKSKDKSPKNDIETRFGLAEVGSRLYKSAIVEDDFFNTTNAKKSVLDDINKQPAAKRQLNKQKTTNDQTVLAVEKKESERDSLKKTLPDIEVEEEEGTKAAEDGDESKDMPDLPGTPSNSNLLEKKVSS